MNAKHCLALMIVATSACKKDDLMNRGNLNQVKNTINKSKEPAVADPRDQYLGTFDGVYKSGIKYADEDPNTRAIINVQPPKIFHTIDVSALITKKAGDPNLLIIALSRKVEKNNELVLEPFLSYECVVPEKASPPAKVHPLTNFTADIKKDFIYIEKNTATGDKHNPCAQHESVTLRRNVPH